MDKIFYNKPNFKTASALAGTDDIEVLKKIGIERMGEIAREEMSPTMQARIGRLVNSGIVPEGKY